VASGWGGGVVGWWGGRVVGVESERRKESDRKRKACLDASVEERESEREGGEAAIRHSLSTTLLPVSGIYFYIPALSTITNSASPYRNLHVRSRLPIGASASENIRGRKESC
jgi:hypothetical protein